MVSVQGDGVSGECTGDIVSVQGDIVSVQGMV